MDDDELADAGTPNCPRDLVPMVLAGDERAPYWRCDECGFVALV
jgi:hypothetical protein